MPKRVAVLVDAMYLQKVCSAFGVDPFDVQKIPPAVLRAGEETTRTYVFDALPFLPENATSDQRDQRTAKRRFFDYLRLLEHVTVEEGHVQPKPTVCRRCGETFVVPVQKQVDVKISVRLVQLAFSHTVDVIVLVCGDGDITPAVKAIDGTGVDVRLAYATVPEQRVFTSGELIRACQEKRYLDRAVVESLRATATSRQ